MMSFKRCISDDSSNDPARTIATVSIEAPGDVWLRVEQFGRFVHMLFDKKEAPDSLDALIDALTEARTEVFGARKVEPNDELATDLCALFGWDAGSDDGIRARVRGLVETASTMAADLTAAHKRVADLEAEVASLRAERDTHANIAEGLRADVERLSRRNRQLSAQIDTYDRCLRIIDTLASSRPR